MLTLSVLIILADYKTQPVPGIEVFHTCDQNHVTEGANPFWGSSFATAAAAVVARLSKLAANLVK